MAKVISIKPDDGLKAYLPGASFADAYQTVVSDPEISAADVAKLMFGRSPLWVSRLMAVRDTLVRPLGLKTSRSIDPDKDKIGLFPVQLNRLDEVVLGFDDAHLDFRAVVSSAAAVRSSTITVTTLVRLNNTLGGLYLSAIMPFHKLIVRSMLGRLKGL